DSASWPCLRATSESHLRERRPGSMPRTDHASRCLDLAVLPLDPGSAEPRSAPAGGHPDDLRGDHVRSVAQAALETITLPALQTTPVQTHGLPDRRYRRHARLAPRPGRPHPYRGHPAWRGPGTVPASP